MINNNLKVVDTMYLAYSNSSIFYPKIFDTTSHIITYSSESTETVTWLHNIEAIKLNEKRL